METLEMAYGVPRMSVVGDCFCVPYPVDLIVKKKLHGFFNLQYQVMDVNGNLHFQVDGSYVNLHQKRVMRNPAGFPILTIRRKSSVKCQRWTVHRGESSEAKDLIFSAEQSFSLQMKTRLEVFSPSNFHHEVSDFRVVDCCPPQSCKVYRGETVIAEINHDITGKSWRATESFKVKVCPVIDYAFIVALITIYSENILNWGKFCHKAEPSPLGKVLMHPQYRKFFP